MLVKHILREKGREVVTISGEAILSEAARVLARRRIGAVIVRNNDGGISGILSERDIVRAVPQPRELAELSHSSCVVGKCRVMYSCLPSRRISKYLAVCAIF